MEKKYTITAGNNNTDCGIIGRANTLLAAKRIAHKYISVALPNGEGEYTVRDEDGDSVLVERRDITTGNKWVEYK